MNDTQLFYDLTAEATAEEWYANEVLLPTLQDFVSGLPPHPRVLDLGCGPGHESARLARLGAQVVGIDFSSRCIAIAAARNPGLTFLEMDFFRLDTSLGFFDGVLASGSLIHVPPGILPDLLARIARLLLPGGLVAAIVRDGIGPVVFHPVIQGVAVERTVHRYDSTTLVAVSESCGLRPLREGVLDDALRDDGWRCYVCQKS